MEKEKLIVVSAPSGSGKTTLIKHLMFTLPKFDFSVSATSRTPRKGEVDGKDYHFISVDKFRALIAENGFIEWEEVYPDRFYGTLKSEVTRIASMGKIALFDVDVKGGVNIKKLYKKQALSIFLQAPSIEILEQRLRNRGTDSETDIQTRVQKAAEELTYAPEFDFVITNDDREKAKEEFVEIVQQFIDS
ncbi:MAG: guanylate kinase [Salinivirgaceae bacterium]|nr:guanylate kinase [Salinivirgaceae bacterium]MDD4748037.1 guanylate kinase [Salinivirgaceae bacterium]MDY0279515.1 guanylate kinase [Salinivirgaceae bacterium]